MFLLMLTAREGHLSSSRQRLLTRPTAALRRKSLRGIAVVCLGTDAGARHSVKTGENAALLNRR
jgi:hypothetical protein